MNLRGGLFSVALAAVRELLSKLFATPSVLIFVEQNDPFRLTAEQYRLDTEVSGTDQFQRLRMWARVGAQLLLFPYVQPPLSAAQAPDTTLVYSLLEPPEPTLDARLLHEHLERFFAISVLKGAALSDEPSASLQLELLASMARRREPVELFDFGPWLDKVMARTDRFGHWPVRPASLIDAISLSGTQPRGLSW